jgi:putative acyl-CoA dehydrogenase
MPGNAPPVPSRTHEVVNQPPPLAPYDAFATDRVLAAALEREGAAWAKDRAARVGVIAGGDAVEWGRLANEHPPVLRSHDRYGHRIDEVEFHPGWVTSCTRSRGASRGRARTSRARRSST